MLVDERSNEVHQLTGLEIGDLVAGTFDMLDARF
jgi:hypothetical protein